ncbi:hypothetical protein GLOIN_2v1782313 [Rhizophagus clarus]|uniref:Uncharacterized protein n=1 Tax=Rhizophagus clarus TaxID=94130 RepID=A0A8H3KXF6_9GLOM|nr:hypothetical protein GLOIN_2v1782313 [Rhizophagus clarus]
MHLILLSTIVFQYEHEEYPGQNVLVSYIKKKDSKASYIGFLEVISHVIITTLISSTDTCDGLDTIWFHHFLKEAKSLLDRKTYAIVKNRANTEHLHYTKFSQTYWQKIFKKYGKENSIPATATTITTSEITDEQKDQEILLMIMQLHLVKHWKKQYQIFEQNKDNIVYKQAIDNALLVSSAHENLIIAGDIIPFIKVLKIRLLARSQMSLSSANESVLQAIIENILPLNCYIPELSLVINGKKPKGSGRFGYSDIFILKDNNVSLELKYISLVGLIKNKVSANELESLDKIIENEDKKPLLKRPYTFWSKENKKVNKTTIGEVLDSGVNQLILYMNTISKGKASNYSSSGVFDKRIRIITKSNSNPNKLIIGFVTLVIGFRRILWRSVDEIISNYIYDKV